MGVQAGDEGAVVADVRVQPDGGRRTQGTAGRRDPALQVVRAVVVVTVVVTVVMIVVVVVRAGARRRHVVVALDPAAELQAVAPRRSAPRSRRRRGWLGPPRGEGLGSWPRTRGSAARPELSRDVAIDNNMSDFAGPLHGWDVGALRHGRQHNHPRPLGWHATRDRAAPAV